MAKKNRKTPAQLTEETVFVAEERRTASVKPLPSTGPVPVQPVASSVQLTPIVQPLAFVPYSSQKQPLFIYEGEEEVEVDDEIIEEEVSYTPPTKQKKVSGLSIFLIITSLLVLAVLIVGKFVSAVTDYTLITNKVGYVLVEELIANIKAGDILVIENVVPAAVALVGVLTVITLLVALFDIKRGGASVFAKIVMFFTLVFAAVVVVMAFTNSLDKGYGMYAVAALVLLQTIFTFFVRREKKQK